MDTITITVRGNRYVAVDGEPGKCGDCAFIDGLGCALWPPNQETECRGYKRADGRHINWIPAHLVKD